MSFDEYFDDVVAPALPGGGADYTNQSLTSFITQTSPNKSAPNSLLAKETSVGTWGHGRIALVDDSNDWVFWVYLTNTGQYALVGTQEDNANYNLARLQFLLQFRAGGVIKYIDGPSTFSQSAKTYSVTGFYEVRFAVDWDAHTYDAWFDGDAVCTDADFSDASESDSGCIVVGANGTGGHSDFSVDNIHIGEEGWPGGAPVRAGSMCGVG